MIAKEKRYQRRGTTEGYLLGVGRGQVKKLEDTNNYIPRSILGLGKHTPQYGWYKNARRKKKISGSSFGI